MEESDLHTTVPQVIGPQLNRLQGVAAGIGIVGLLLSLYGAAMNIHAFWFAYLAGFLFWLGASLGCLALLMIHNATGGGWGYVIRRFAEGGASLLPLTLIFFIPVLFGIPDLFSWTHPQTLGRHLQLLVAAKEPWLNLPRWYAFAALYFIVWIGWSAWLRKLGNNWTEGDNQRNFNWANYVGAWGLVVYLLTMTAAFFDWVVSLTPGWNSSIVGLLVTVSQTLTGLCLIMLLLGALAGDAPIVRRIPSAFFRDLGNLMITMVMAWAYLSFSQYLLTYSGNLQNEVAWYQQRNSAGWVWMVPLLMILHFLFPFMVLLVGSNIKKDPKKLARVAFWLLLIRYLDVIWWVVPSWPGPPDSSFATMAPRIAGIIGVPMLLGGIWLWAWGQAMKKEQTVVPVHDPRLTAHLQEVVQHA